MSVAHLRLQIAVEALPAFSRLYASDPFAFLCESLGEAGRNRYSFFGGRPTHIHRSHPDGITIEEMATGAFRADPRDLLDSIRSVLEGSEAFPGVSPFSSGVVGYLGYDIVRRFERLPASPPDPEGLPDSILLVPSEIVVVDHQNAITDIVVHGSGSDARAAEIRDRLETCSGPEPFMRTQRAEATLRPLTARPDFEAGVDRILEHIREGDIFQGVLSQRFEAAFAGDPLDLYRALRKTNPSPYMYFLKLGATHAVLGSSPEVLVSLEGRRAMTRPLAGTRPRGVSPESDRLHAENLLADEKERAEHVMLVDLARNDLGRVCEYGSVLVTRQFEVERHARVMHIFSEVEGQLGKESDALDLLRATFPAGTVTGAPKVRAMEIIDSLEPVRRGLYGGAIGYIDPAGRMDLCLAIRTLVVHHGRVLLQAGAGVVADSDPSREYEETKHKASALVHALEVCAPSLVPNGPEHAEFTSVGARGSGGLSTSGPTSAAPRLNEAEAEFTSVGARGSGG
ncbi:MAG: anthranilate synthase component I family protein, partial [Vicinamibacteria bacterium]|nr:anthranilate synthase component I family protein [Vicinamibacteria bacterium]